jgi:hypothetical protein
MDSVPEILLVGNASSFNLLIKQELAKEVTPTNVMIMDRVIKDVRYLVNMLELLKIKHLTCLNCEFQEKAAHDMSHCTILEEVHLIDCRDEFAFMRGCLTCPKLKFISTDKQSSIWRRYDISTLPQALELMANTLMDNYSLTSFDFRYLNEYVKGISKMNRQVNVVLHAEDRITGLIHRNLKGYHRCRQVVYTLFLIKRYGNNRVMRLMDRNILMIIGKLVLKTLGDKVWCIGRLLN